MDDDLLTLVPTVFVNYYCWELLWNDCKHSWLCLCQHNLVNKKMHVVAYDYFRSLPYTPWVKTQIKLHNLVPGCHHWTQDGLYCTLPAIETHYGLQNPQTALYIHQKMNVDVRREGSNRKIPLYQVLMMQMLWISAVRLKRHALLSLVYYSTFCLIIPSSHCPVRMQVLYYLNNLTVMANWGRYVHEEYPVLSVLTRQLKN